MRFFLYPGVPCNYWQPIIASQARVKRKKGRKKSSRSIKLKGHKNCHHCLFYCMLSYDSFPWLGTIFLDYLYGAICCFASNGFTPKNGSWHVVLCIRQQLFTMANFFKQVSWKNLKKRIAFVQYIVLVVQKKDCCMTCF